jgi:hypothetical protein
VRPAESGQAVRAEHGLRVGEVHINANLRAAAFLGKYTPHFEFTALDGHPFIALHAVNFSQGISN